MKSCIYILLFAWSAGIASSQTAFDNLYVTDGNVHVAGVFQETGDFDPGSGTTTVTNIGSDFLLLI